MSDAPVYIDLEGGLARVRGNHNLYKRMLGLFVQSTEFQAFEDAVTAEDWAKGAEIAHAIKGMTGNLSLTAVFEESTQLMTQMRQGAPDPGTLARYREALSETQRQAAQLMETL